MEKYQVKCYNCKKDIDLELTPEEETIFEKEMEAGNAVMLCIDCCGPIISSETTDTIDNLENG